ncbi:MAG TPA: methyltransferase, partial [Marmoricola sp.]
MTTAPPDIAASLRAALTAADYTYAATSALLGDEATAALARNETTPGRRAVRGAGPLGTLVGLWLLQSPVALDDAEQALPGLVDPLCAAGVLERSVSEVAARIDVRPYAVDDGELWIASDLTPGLDGAPTRVGSDHVLGVSSASTSLAELTVRRPVRRALDLGTGCGVQALHLASHADTVVATDLNPRALWLTRFNVDLNDLGGIETREGSFFDAVGSETFDLIVTNPPFVISPATGERLVYRDSGLPGDRVVEDIVRAVPQRLNPGGAAQILANWLILDEHPWDERLAAWIDGCDAWVVQREVADPAEYVEMWLKDSGHHPATGGSPEDYRRRYDTWLSWLAEQGASGVGFGWINLRRTEEDPALRLEEWPYEIARPLGPEIADHFDRVGALRDVSDLFDVRLRLRADAVQETLGPAGAEDPSQILLRQQTGLRRARQVDTATAAWVGACDGDLTLGQIVDAVAQLLGTPSGELRA